MSFLAQPVQTPLQLVPQLVGGMMPWLIAGAVFVLLVTYLKKRFLPKVKGALGEWSVNQALLRRLNGEEYEVLENLRKSRPGRSLGSSNQGWWITSCPSECRSLMMSGRVRPQSGSDKPASLTTRKP